MEERRVEPTAARCPQVVVLRVGHDAYDGEFQISERRTSFDLPPNRICITEEGAGHRLIDHSGQRRVSFVLRPDFTAQQDGNIRGRKIFRPNVIVECAYLLSRWRSVTINRDVHARIYVAEETAQGQTSAADTGNGADALEQLLVKLVNGGALISLWWSNTELQEVLAVVAHFRLRQLLKAAQE